MRYWLDLWVLHSMSASHIFDSTATVTQQNAKVAHDFRRIAYHVRAQGPDPARANLLSNFQDFGVFRQQLASSRRVIQNGS